MCLIGPLRTDVNSQINSSTPNAPKIDLESNQLKKEKKNRFQNYNLFLFVAKTLKYGKQRTLKRSPSSNSHWRLFSGQKKRQWRHDFSITAFFVHLSLRHMTYYVQNPESGLHFTDWSEVSCPSWLIRFYAQGTKISFGLLSRTRF